jgi:hypothetical protein
MNGKEVALTAGCAALLLVGATYYALNIVRPKPTLAEHVGLVMLANAMQQVDSAVAAIDPSEDVSWLDCKSKDGGTVTCEASGFKAYRVSFANTARGFAFELKGRRYDRKIHVTSFTGVPAVIPQQEVDRFTSAFDGAATAQILSAK